MKDYYSFREAIKQRESSGNYKTINQFGYLGAYQFGKARLLDLGISIDGYGKITNPKLYLKAKKMTKEEFLNNKELQDALFFRHVRDLLRIIRDRYKNYINKQVREVFLTESGLVAAVHLVGFGGLAKWLNGKDVKDGNGVKIEEYLTKFAGYDLDNY